MAHRAEVVAVAPHVALVGDVMVIPWDLAALGGPLCSWILGGAKREVDSPTAVPNQS